jgi:hypothetical protein
VAPASKAAEAAVAATLCEFLWGNPVEAVEAMKTMEAVQVEGTPQP